jgi:uncharacterized protein
MDKNLPSVAALIGVVASSLCAGARTASAFGDKTLEAYTQSCLRGGDNDCATAGYMYQNGVDAPVDFDRARGFFKRACKDGLAAGCYDMGTLYEYGQGVAVDYEAAAKLYEKACKGDEITACVNLGNLYEKGQGVPQDPAKAAALYRDVCAKPTTGRTKRHWRTEVVSGGCNRLAVLYERGAGVPQDVATAESLYQKSCGLQNQDACRNLNILHVNGPSTKAPKVEKQEYSGDGPTLK